MNLRDYLNFGDRSMGWERNTWYVKVIYNYNESKQHKRGAHDLSYRRLNNLSEQSVKVPHDLHVLYQLIVGQIDKSYSDLIFI